MATKKKNNRSAPLGIGIIGCGLMGDIHADCYTRNRNSRIVATYNPTHAKALALAEKYGGTACVDINELLASPAVDAVAICSPQVAHHEQIVAASRAGKHIFCEKPVALTAAELDNAEAVVAKHKVTFMTGHQLRFHPVITAVQKAMPRLGPIYHVDFEWCFRIDAHEGRCWESYRQGGFFMELGCHATDLAGCLLGKVAHVSGHTLRLNPKRITEDYTNVLLQFESGAVAQILVSANHRTKRQGMLRGRVVGDRGRIDFTVYPYKRSFNEATLTIDYGKKVFVPDTKTTKLRIPNLPSPSEVYPGFFDVYDRQAAAFIESVKTGTPPPCTLADGRQAIEVVLATYHTQNQATRTQNFVKRPKRYLSNANSHPLLSN
jgi:predicted dehydrogenase